MPINTVKSHLKRSLETLREKTFSTQPARSRTIQHEQGNRIPSACGVAARGAKRRVFSETSRARHGRSAYAAKTAAPPRAGVRPLAWWLTASLAACLILAVGVNTLGAATSAASGLEARREVVEALRMTSQKLNLAYEAVKNQSTSLSDGKSGV